MSLANSPDWVFRAEEMNMKAYFPASADEGNSFDDFFNEGMYDAEGSDGDNNAQLDQFEDIFSDAFNQAGYKPPSFDNSAAKTASSSPQPWRKGVWCMKQAQQPPKLT